ncbi:peptidylprolyl isomerase [Roseofilum capinflatum]|uniref:Peptidyl-prolyl cis-trans isomerase n=1 Tax=Roseofilum capinflatum BLCC-M114 TaxID=3022440 RepID=A0ABT7BB07_9CYAN|nr:peptidylprolyl isomerase [Roseofilum capinflatum]MDJ1176355.1 peptidylprolyl isomerase [Roseofilum capinflatum BLCC-M114]
MQLRPKYWVISLMLLSTLAIAGCSGNLSAPESDGSPTAPDVTASPVSSPDRPFEGLPTLNGQATVAMTVNGSPITINVDGTKAPVTAGNFVDLVERGFYDGLTFHRVVREPQPFVVQGGDPLGNGTGGFIDPATGEERQIPLEITPEGESEPIYGQTFPAAQITKPPALQHTRGAVAMARSQFPDSASSQFYFTLSDLSFLDGNYAVFGYVTEGMDAIDQIQEGDRIESAKVTQGLENLKR